MPKTEEYKDKRGDNRIRHTADNGKVTYASSEGYKNKSDMRESAINAAIGLLEHYMNEMRLTSKQFLRVEELGKDAADSLDIRQQSDIDIQ
jgi:uncharacterized protein YegP (UPF0339 family)